MALRVKLTAKDRNGVADSVILDVETITGSRTLTAQQFSPLMPRSLGTAMFGSNFNPKCILNFQQWSESYTLSCFKGELTHFEQADYITALRYWIMKKQGDVYNKMYMRAMVDTIPSPDVCHLNAKGLPWTTSSTYGFEGLITAGPNETYTAGNKSVIFDLTFQVGMVIMI